MISASKTTLSLNNLKILRPKVTKNCTNLRKKFCEFPPWGLWSIKSFFKQLLHRFCSSFNQIYYDQLKIIDVVKDLHLFCKIYFGRNHFLREKKSFRRRLRLMIAKAKVAESNGRKKRHFDQPMKRIKSWIMSLSLAPTFELLNHIFSFQ